MKRIHTKFRGYIRTGGQSNSTSGHKKSGANKDATFFECKQPGHYKNECPKLIAKRKFFREKKKVLMATWDELEASEDDYEEEKANMALKAST